MSPSIELIVYMNAFLNATGILHPWNPVALSFSDILHTPYTFNRMLLVVLSVETGFSIGQAANEFSLFTLLLSYISP